MEVCNKKKNSISVYRTKEDMLCGEFKVQKNNYDMQTVIIIGLGDHTKTENRLLKMLDILFAKDMSAPEKQKLLEQMGIAMTEETKEEVKEMCNLGEGIYEQGIEQGREDGIEAFIKDNLEEKIPESKIAEKLKRRFSLSEKAAKEKIRKYGTVAVV